MNPGVCGNTISHTRGSWLVARAKARPVVNEARRWQTQGVNEHRVSETVRKSGGPSFVFKESSRSWIHFPDFTVTLLLDQGNALCAYLQLSDIDFQYPIGGSEGTSVLEPGSAIWTLKAEMI